MLKALRQKYTDGFTLIELMIVVAIVGILAAIAVPNFLAYRNKSRVAAATGSVDSIRAALAAYASGAPGNTYPSDTDITDYATLVTLVNMHGGSLRSTEAEQGFNLTAYTPVDADSDGTFEDYTISFSVLGIGAGVKGSVILASPRSIDQTS